MSHDSALHLGDICRPNASYFVTINELNLCPDSWAVVRYISVSRTCFVLKNIKPIKLLLPLSLKLVRSRFIIIKLKSPKVKTLECLMEHYNHAKFHEHPSADSERLLLVGFLQKVRLTRK
jgi:hypothetical protein